jgi:hypothetical protein
MPPMLHTHLSSGVGTVDPFEAAVPRELKKNLFYSIRVGIWPCTSSSFQSFTLVHSSSSLSFLFHFSPFHVAFLFSPPHFPSHNFMLFPF